MRTLAASLVLGACLAAPAAGALTLVSQARSVSAFASLSPSFGTPQTESETKTAPDSAPFSDAASAGLGFVGATSHQTSTITTSGGAPFVDATGDAAGQSFSMGLSRDFGSADAASRLSITFTLDAAQAFALSAAVSGTNVVAPPPDPSPNPGSMSASIELLDGSGAAIAQLARSSPASTAFDERAEFSGRLEPGTYTLRAAATGGASGDFYNLGFASGRAAFAVELSLVPEPGALGLLVLALLGARGLEARSRAPR